MSITEKALETVNSIAGKVVNATAQELNNKPNEHKLKEISTALDTDIHAQELKNQVEREEINEIERRSNETEALIKTIREKQILNHTLHHQEPTELQTARQAAEKRAELLNHELNSLVDTGKEGFVAIEANNTGDSTSHNATVETSFIGETADHQA